MKKNVISLFSSAGIGDLGIKANNLDIVISNEILKDRHELFKSNFAGVKCFDDDIRKVKDEIIQYYIKNFKIEDLFMIYATPPCQGMSTNGAGRLSFETMIGNRTGEDERNRLIIPTMDIITILKPQWILLENVPGMLNTAITDENGKLVKIVDYIESRLGPEYVGRPEVIACEDYGIAQVRKRLITIYTRDENGKKYFNENLFSFFPKSERKPKITLKEAIGHLPPLDSKEGYNENKDFHPLHFVPIIKPEKYWWLSYTREGDQAYNNQCVNKKCGYKLNPLHSDTNVNGKWISNKNTPIYCQKCGELLPRPSMIDRVTGERRLIKGFHSAYRRMLWDKPANTLTQNFLFEASDNKIHPEQNRVLSLYEALIIQTISDYKYDFLLKGRTISKNHIAEIIGESVPPRLIDMICKKIVNVSECNSTLNVDEEKYLKLQLN